MHFCITFGRLLRKPQTPETVDAALFDPDDLPEDVPALCRDDRGSEGVPADREGHREMKRSLSGTPPALCEMFFSIQSWHGNS